VSSIGLVPGAAGTGLATLVGLIRSLSGPARVVTHHRIAAGVPFQAGALIPTLPENDQAAALLAVPEVAWTAFATVLSTAVAAKNSRKDTSNPGLEECLRTSTT
jgi:hypothetical protein